MKSRFFLFLLCFVIVPFASSSSLVVQLSNNLPNNITQNIQAYLGIAPTNKNEYAAFIFTAKKKTSNALNSLGYYRAVVTNTFTDELTDTSTLAIDVVLNQPTRIKQVDININGDALSDRFFSEFLRKIPIASGDILHHGVYEKFKENLISLGLERGYFDSKFITSTIAIHKDLDTADIIINFDSGSRYQFGEISLNFTDNAPNPHTNINVNAPNLSHINPDVLKPLISFQQGDYYQQTLLQNLQNELDKTQFFSNVVVRPATEKTINNILPVDVSLEKEKSHQLDLGLGYATDTKQNFSFGWKTPLVNRFGHRQETRLSYSKINPTGHFIYGIPLTHPNNDILQFKALLEENDYG
ncbi:MAG: POTRA domain-containing protein, partial [Thalassotalea sp.]|nr:POTRA domain-containing protein [Thalassotalea sp.]